jgi:hypothetical protein
MSIHEKALQGIFDDMDDLESKKMFQPSKGMSVTITMTPDESHIQEEKEEGISGDQEFEDLPADHDPDMCGGGCAYHLGGTIPKPKMEGSEFSGYDKGDPEYKKEEMKMAQGGIAGLENGKDLVMGSRDELDLPPFLRKKKIPSNR